MKTFIDRFFNHTSRFEFILLFVPFVLWIYCFQHFFTGRLPLFEDAISYADHIQYYTDNLRHGVYPLWSPEWFSGSPYHFFLRRIGDVNPLLFIIVLLKSVGIPSATSYLIFLAIYYFLAAWAFYLITRLLLVDRFYAFSAYILLLFSSWGSEIFYNYIIIIFVPIIWFFYFLLRFAKNPQKGAMLGLCFCVGLIVTTYIPFFFLTIFGIFLIFYVLFYAKNFFAFLRDSFTFFSKNAVFAIICLAFLFASCIPALIFYKESKSGQFVLPNRHSGADTSSAVAVGIDNVASGDIISHGYFDRIFDDQANIDMGDVYLPYVFFLILFMTISARVNKLIFFLLFNILALFLITITSSGKVHHFLYEHVIIFKFIRNIYYFFWLAMLPMAILLTVSAFKSFLLAIKDSSHKTAWFVYTIVCHLLFVLFLFLHQGVLWGAWIAVLLSLLYFIIYFLLEKKVSYIAGFCLFLFAVFFQSIQVYQSLDNKLFAGQKSFQLEREKIKNVTVVRRLDLYYASSWFAILVNYIDPRVLDDYRNRQFIFYSNLIPYNDSPEFFKTLQNSMQNKSNVAYVSADESQAANWRRNPDAAPQADFDPIASGKVSLISSDANTMKLKAHLAEDQFLVINDNFNNDWHAFINGHPAHIFRANVSFKGLWIPAGESTVLLRFSTPKQYLLHISLIILFIAVFICFLVLLSKDPSLPLIEGERDIHV